MATVEFTKEMVDLLTKIKKHLRDKYGIAVSLADPQVLERLLEIRHINDQLLQGMIRYLMALSGGDWPARYENRTTPEPEPKPPVPGVKPAKKAFGFYRGSNVAPKEESGDKPSEEKKKPVRY